ncbi:hypothetical protein PTI98_005747 [Pleurotus ostreatus]|nr:hypothetical protein PTI98_005747 [Pleurotus ostreatus]
MASYQLATSSLELYINLRGKQLKGFRRAIDTNLHYAKYTTALTIHSLSSSQYGDLNRILSSTTSIRFLEMRALDYSLCQASLSLPPTFKNLTSLLWRNDIARKSSRRARAHQHILSYFTIRAARRRQRESLLMGLYYQTCVQSDERTGYSVLWKRRWPYTVSNCDSFSSHTDTSATPTRRAQLQISPLQHRPCVFFLGLSLTYIASVRWPPRPRSDRLAPIAVKRLRTCRRVHTPSVVEIRPRSIQPE